MEEKKTVALPVAERVKQTLAKAKSRYNAWISTLIKFNKYSRQ